MERPSSAGLLPATYLVRFVGFLAGAFFWHVIPVLAVLPASERSRIPPPLSSVPTDAEYAMDLISQRVARGLPVRPKRRKVQRRHSPSLGVAIAADSEHHDDERSTSTSVNWNKWGDRLAFTKDRTGDLRNVFRDGQWKKSDGWKEFITPLAAKVVAPQGGPETRVDAHTFPAQFKQRPGLITLTPTTVFFTPLLSSRATLCIPLQDVTGVKKGSLMKGIDIHYSEPFVDGSKEAKEAKFLFVGSRDDLFARLVSYGGKRWKNVALGTKGQRLWPALVYAPVKQELFFTDVTTCYNALKKAVQDLSSMSANAAQLQMGQPTLRAEALTLTADPGAAFGIDFDNVFVVVNSRPSAQVEDDDLSDDDFDPRFKRPKAKGKQKRDAPSSAIVEHARALHTLDEQHGHLLNSSLGFRGGSAAPGGGMEASSSQFDGGFGLGFDDSVFALPEGAGEADIGDELARELGEGWGGSVLRGRQDDGPNPFDLGADAFDLNADFAFDAQAPEPATSPGLHDRASLPPSGSVVVPLAPFSPPGPDGLSNVVGQPPHKRPKRVRLLLDARTELTDDELKEQELLKREIAQKKLEKESGKLIEEMIYGVPKGVQAPVLVDFWLENFRIQVEARSGELHVDVQGEPPRKRRKLSDMDVMNENEEAARGNGFQMDVDQNLGYDLGGGDYIGFQDVGDGYELDRMRSSEEPGQARRGSRPPSALGSHFDFDLRPTQDQGSASQRSAFFPWDHAGPSSSAVGVAYEFDGSDAYSALRSASKRGHSIGSRRESLLLPGAGAIPPSPASMGLRSSQVGGEDFQFNAHRTTWQVIDMDVVPEEQGAVEESQQSGILTLERNSFNFLEYAKMQISANPSATSELPFDDVVPKATSTRRVAAAAFYHCLVLSTKNLINVGQDVPYGPLKIRVK
ncbi:hypothetical protein ACG7TL_000425 [Trametes sanguinea]